jgi:RND family efflux transporter MFP subunit
MQCFLRYAVEPRRIAFLLASAAVAACVVTVAGCGLSPQGPSKGPEGPAAEPSSSSISIVKPERRAIPLSVRQPGSIQAYEQTPIFAKIAGYVRKWTVDIGAQVRKGDVLAELYVPEMVEELNQKKEAVKQANEAFEVATARIATAAARVKEAQAGVPRAEHEHQFWRLQYDRLSKVNNALETQVKDETWNKLQAAAAAWKEAEAKVETSQAALKEAEAVRNKAKVDIGAAEKDRDRLSALLSYTRLLAPYDGVVTRRNINTDDFVQPPTGGKGEPLYVVERRDKMRVVVEVPEAEASWVVKGLQARIRVQALKWREFSAPVERTSYSINRTARTLIAEIDLRNDPQDLLRPGMYVIAMISGEKSNALTVPASAVMTQGDVTQGYQTYCFVMQNGKAVRTPIQIGLSGGGHVELLRKQTKPGEWEDFSGAEEIIASAASVTESRQ